MGETVGLALLLQQTAAPSGNSVLVSYIPILMMLAMAGGLGAILVTTSRLVAACSCFWRSSTRAPWSS